MMEHSRFNNADPATKREQLAKLRRGLHRSIFDGVDPAVVMEPVPVKELLEDVYAANGAVRREPGMGSGMTARNAEASAVSGAQLPPTPAPEFIPKQH